MLDILSKKELNFIPNEYKLFKSNDSIAIKHPTLKHRLDDLILEKEIM